jgi:hypothetical protein
MANDDSINFSNLLEVLAYLQNSKIKISKSALYRHRNEGKIRPQDDSSFTQAAVDKYARNFLQPLGHDPRAAKPLPDSDHQEKQAADTRKAVAQAIHWETKTAIMRGLYAEVAIVDRKHAGKASVLKSGIENAVRIRTPDSIHLAKGQDIFIPDVTEFWLNVFGELLDQYAEPIDFEVPSAADLDRIEDSQEAKED